MRNSTTYLGLLLLLAPTWIACYWALGSYHPAYGLLIGFTSVFWGTASFTGWVIFLVSIKKKLWGVGISLLLLLFNIMTLSIEGEYENIKREKHFVLHKTELELVANKILQNEINIQQANAILTTKEIIFKAIPCVSSSSNQEAFFYADGALDSQLGYAYQKKAVPTSNCYDVRRWRPVARNWWYGVR
jgi:hypothetical protein